MTGREDTTESFEVGRVEIGIDVIGEIKPLGLLNELLGSFNGGGTRGFWHRAPKGRLGATPLEPSKDRPNPNSDDWHRRR